MNGTNKPDEEFDRFLPCVPKEKFTFGQQQRLSLTNTLNEYTVKLCKKLRIATQPQGILQRCLLLKSKRMTGKRDDGTNEHEGRGDKHECEFFLDNESVPFFCECGKMEIGAMEYYPEEQVKSLREQLASERALIKRFVDSMALLEVELLKERALRKELVDGLHLAWTYVNEGADMLMDTDAKKAHAEFRAASREIRALIQKSKSLDEQK